MSTTWVIGETRDGAPKRVTDELITAAHHASPGAAVVVVLLGSGLDDAARTLSNRDVASVLVLDDERLAAYSPDGWANALADLARESMPDVVLGAATSRGRELLARLSAALDVSMASDVAELAVTDGYLDALRPTYAGRALVRVRLSGAPLVATVRPNSYPAAEARPEAAPIERRALGDYAAGAGVTSFDAPASTRPDVAEADAIVSGGRGMGAPEHFHLVENLADELAAAVGASRAVVDAGWRPHGEQVGQTGKTVAPSLYVACGISGAIQHVAGMKTAKVIVAINKDPEAPIFALADYGLVADVFEALPAVTAALRQHRGR